MPLLPPAQRERFLDYLPSHSQGVAGIMLVSSLNAVCYNMVRRAVLRPRHACCTSLGARASCCDGAAAAAADAAR